MEELLLSTLSKNKEMELKMQLLSEEASIGLELNTSDLLHFSEPLILNSNNSDKEYIWMKQEQNIQEIKTQQFTELELSMILKKSTTIFMLEELSLKTSMENASEILHLFQSMEEPSNQ